MSIINVVLIKYIVTNRFYKKIPSSDLRGQNLICIIDFSVHTILYLKKGHKTSNKT